MEVRQQNCIIQFDNFSPKYLELVLKYRSVSLTNLFHDRNTEFLTGNTVTRYTKLCPWNFK